MRTDCADKTLFENLSFAGLEAYKQIRASLSFLVPKDSERSCRVLGITSSVAGEGKTTTALNLAYVLAEDGQKVLLIEADMRRPSIQGQLGLKQKRGLSNALSSSGDVRSYIVQTQHKNWDVLIAGTIPPNPSELLSSDRFRQIIETESQHYDYILIDLPPVNVVSDAIVVSNVTDGLIIVARQEYTDMNELAECVRRLKTVNVKILGIIGNAAQNEYGRYYSKHKYSRYYK